MLVWLKLYFANILYMVDLYTVEMTLNMASCEEKFRVSMLKLTITS